MEEPKLSDKELNYIDKLTKTYRANLILKTKKSKIKKVPILEEVSPCVWHLRTKKVGIKTLNYKHVERLSAFSLYLTQDSKHKIGLLNMNGEMVVSPRFDILITRIEDTRTIIEATENKILYRVEYYSGNSYQNESVEINRAPTNEIEEIIYTLNDREGYDEIALCGLYEDDAGDTGDKGELILANRLIKLLRDELEKRRK